MLTTILAQKNRGVYGFCHRTPCGDDTLFIHQGRSSSSMFVFVLGVSLYAPNTAEPMSAKVAKIAIMVL
jgi:hypothetical protein